MTLLRTLFYLMIGLALCSRPAAADAPGDVGHEYSDYPNTACKDYEGITLGQGRGYSVSTANCGGTYEAWLSRELKTDGRDSTSAIGDTNKPPRMIVVDHLKIRALNKGERFSPGPYCYLRKKEIEWVAIYAWNGRKRISNENGGIVAAWIVNLEKGQFEAAPARLLKSAICLASDDE